MTDENTGNDLKEILRRYPTGITVVTSLLEGKPWGGTMNSFTSVSLNPPLVAVFVMEDSRTTAAIQETGKFVVNIMKHDQEGHSMQFANDGVEDKFQGVPYKKSEDGIPILDNSLGYIECDLYTSQKIADHIMFVGQVKKASVMNDEEALLYYKRAFRSLA